MRECKEGFKEEESDTTVRIKLWALMTAIIGLSVGVMSILYARDAEMKMTIDINSNRITRLEVMMPLINSNLEEIRGELKLIRQQGKR